MIVLAAGFIGIILIIGFAVLENALKNIATNLYDIKLAIDSLDEDVIENINEMRRYR